MATYSRQIGQDTKIILLNEILKQISRLRGILGSGGGGAFATYPSRIVLAGCDGSVDINGNRVGSNKIFSLPVTADITQLVVAYDSGNILFNEMNDFTLSIVGGIPTITFDLAPLPNCIVEFYNQA